tara:strand:+ start:26155 stop:26322 length:168 start_codon:yes stop_codon:yes gene_type:complete
MTPALVKARWVDVSGVFCGTVPPAYMVVNLGIYPVAECGILYPSTKRLQKKGDNT